MAVCLLAIAAMITVTILINKGVIGLSGDSTPTTQTPIDDGQNANGDTGGDQPVVTDDPTDDTPPADVTPTAIVLKSPVETQTVLQGYSMDSLVWNSTLKHYAVHNGIDYGGADGTNVYCAYDGTVTDVSYDVLKGYSVTIKHSDDLSTVYSSLNEPVVTVGQTVKQGGIIGTMGVTATAEYDLGAHVHFTVLEKGAAVNPESYMTATESK